ncbi:MAG: DUF4173 domain-containing protein [Cyanobacteria bacterium REEB67]|nr:DUF4173 domain-containing protein [Cyanobacteria bacterium REEB67]
MQKSVLIIGLSISIGLIADALLKNTLTTGIPIGLGITLFIQILAAATTLLAFNKDMPLGRKGLYFLIPSVLFSTGFVLRDSPTLLAIDAGVIFLSLTFAAISLTGRSVTTAGIGEYLLHIANGFLIPLVSTADMLSNSVDWERLIPENAQKHIKPLMRGLAIGLPLTAVFLALFMSGDAAFAAIAGKSLSFDFGDLCLNSTIVVTTAWLSGGFLHSFTLSKFAQGGALNEIALAESPMLMEYQDGEFPLRTIENRLLPRPGEKPGLKLGITEIATALALVDVLFFSFVCVQLKFLFGGASLVELTPGLSFADYARNGFFSLNIAAALVLPVLLVADHMLTRTSTISLNVFRALSFTLLGLLSVVMASAMMRMHLYQSEYGQSELRLYTSAFMGWLAMVCVVFGGTVLVGKRKYFAFGSFVSGLFVIFGLHAANPDAMIAVANIAHAKTGKTFDAAYLMTLSNDAIPTIIKNLEGLPVDKKRLIASKLVNEQKGAWHGDWRAFNWSRMNAYQAVENNLPRLKELASKGDSHVE